MAYVQHPTAKRIVREVEDSALKDWIDAGWEEADALEGTDAPSIPAETETPLVLTQGAQNGDAPAPADDAPRTRTRKEA